MRYRYVYKYKTGLTRVKTKLAIAFTALGLGVGGIIGSVAIFGTTHATNTNNGTDQFGPFSSTSTDNDCAGPWANDSFDRSFIVHNNGDGTFAVREEFKNGSFVTLGSPSPGSTCPNDPHHGTTLLSGIKGNFQGFLVGTVTSSSYNPNGCSTPTDCSTLSDFLSAVFDPTSSFTCNLGYTSCDFNFEYNSSDKSLKYHHWQDREDTSNNTEQFIGDIANQ